MNILKKYWEKSYVYVLLVIPCTCMCAAIYYTIKKLQGNFPTTPILGVYYFDLSQMIYLFISLIIVFKHTHDATFIPRHLLLLKIYVTLVLFVQYNFILHLFPTNYVWVCTYIFLVLVMFFFDIKMLSLHIIGYFVFLFIGHILHPKHILPIHIMMHDEEYLYHIIVMAITLICLLFITYFVQHFLLQAQIDEAENQFLLEKQLEYYQHTDLMDKELRKFRHDIKNHFVVMQNLLLDNQLEDCLSYFQNLQEDFSFQEKLYFSGNIIVDSILNYNLAHNCCPNAKITVYGNLPEIHQISAIDLCTIFSNMLSNAITAVNDCQLEEPELSVHFKSGQQYFSITVTNNFSPSDLDSSILRKLDRNHGFGIDKIKSIISIYQGNFEQTSETNTVTTTIYLPI